MAGYPGGFGGRSPSAPPYGGQPLLSQVRRYSSWPEVLTRDWAWFLVKRPSRNSRKSGRELVGCLAADVCRVIIIVRCFESAVHCCCSLNVVSPQSSVLSPTKGSVSRCLTDVMSQSSSFVCSRNVLFSSFGHWWLVPKGSTVTLEQEIKSNPWVFWWAARNASGYERTEWAVDNLHIVFILQIFFKLQQDWDIIERAVLR